MRRYEEHHEEKGKDTKISKIFQLAVTALSFLAFGGYLLTLIITAIRRNSSNTNNGNFIVVSVSRFPSEIGKTRVVGAIEKQTPGIAFRVCVDFPKPCKPIDSVENIIESPRASLFQNLQALQNYNRPKRNTLIFDPAENDFEIEKLYRGMIMLSRSYATYN